MERVLKYTAGSDYAGKDIKTLLKTHFKISSSLIASLKKYDGISVNGSAVRTNYILCLGDEVTITMREGASQNIKPVKTELDIVYEDEDVMVLNKPPNMPVHPSPGHYENTLANGIMYYFKELGSERVFRAVNRLDKDTSGLMAVAKNGYAHALLCDEIKSGVLEKKYLAIVCGNVERDGTVDAPIARASGSVIKRTVNPNGQRAVTRYRVISHFSEYTLLELSPETGRTHQIRVHMAYIGHPLLGDWLYGKENKSLFPRHALHSCFLRFVHPVTGREMEFTSALPPDMREFTEK